MAETRAKILRLVKAYMEQVASYQEMRYLLLEKDIEERDALDLITKYKVYKFLESKFAENVVHEIWRSPYATGNNIFTASTNFFLLFDYYHCIQDLEMKNRLFRGKNIKSISNHPMQFTVWRFSGKSRVIIEFFTTAIIASVIHWLLRQILDLNDGVTARVN